MMDLRDLYQEVIVDHSRRPRNFGKIADATHFAEGFNPLCGDKLTVFVKADAQQIITEVAFEGSGCAISTASASLMTEALKGKSIQQAEALFRGFHDLIMNQPAADPIELGKLQVLAGVKDFPSRVKCATLAWHTLHAALEAEGQPVSTPISTE